MKLYKKESKDKLEIGEIFYAKRFDLTVDKSRCKGCMLCKIVCPREAITIRQVPKSPDGKAQPPVINIDENKCDFHGICAVVCPFSAIKITHDSKEKVPAVSKEAFPELIRDIEIDSSLCKSECRKCEEKCPLKAVTVKFEPFTDEEKLEREKKGISAGGLKTVVQIEKELCAGCEICWVECPTDAVKVHKFYEGSIKIKQELCPEGCSDCLDICPVKALEIGEGKKVYVNDASCIYCGACQNVCPQPEALDIKRTAVRHTPIESGAWNKALEKMTSTAGLERELSAKRAFKAREAINNLKLPR